MVGEKLLQSDIRLVNSLPSLGQTPLGTMVYDLGTNRIYVRIISGWKYVAMT